MFCKKGDMLIFASRSERNIGDFVAQLVEQYTFNVWVLGSSPNGITKMKTARIERFLFLPMFTLKA